ncbi:MAG: DUF4416 family protein [Candidatus Omnitrophica bacterium]|nr:DUF4416 family protein [Candidatus Omnitrophota bacterium]
MGILLKQKPVKLVSSIIYREEGSLSSIMQKMCRCFGEVEPLQAKLPFDKTDYYYEEFGKPLMRKLVCFKRLVDPEKIYRVKLVSNRLEDGMRVGGNRTVNVDPGYITEAKLILLTTKDYSHRIYLRGRIFAESTLCFTKGSFQAWPWTYPDYSSREVVEYFMKVREKYMEDIKNMSQKNFLSGIKCF